MTEKDNKREYDVFISYSRKDYVDEQNKILPNNFVSKIKESLTDAGISYWFDNECIHYGEDFIKKVVANIESSKIFVFLSTENSNKSRWTRKEIGCADELKKTIIPVRIDATPYDKQIMFRISDLNYIEYYNDAENAIKDLINAINVRLEEIKEEEKLKQEEERRKKEIEQENIEKLRQQKEEEERRRKEEQEQYILTIQIENRKLNNIEDRLEIDRAELIARTGLIKDVKLRGKLKEEISKGGSIHLKYQQKYKKQIDALKVNIASLKENIASLERELLANKKWWKSRMFIWRCLIFTLIVFLIGALVISSTDEKEIIVQQLKSDTLKLNRELSVARNRIAAFQKKSGSTQDTILVLNQEIYKIRGVYDAYKNIPCIIQDVEVGADGKYGETIIGSETKYIYTKIKYSSKCDREKTDTFYIRFLDANRNITKEGKEPGYSIYRGVKLKKGDAIDVVLQGWGNPSKNYWKPGKYFVQILYKNNVLAEESFKVK